MAYFLIAKENTCLIYKEKKTSETQRRSHTFPPPRHPNLGQQPLENLCASVVHRHSQAILVGLLTLPGHWLGCPQGKGQMHKRGTSPPGPIVFTHLLCISSGGTRGTVPVTGSPGNCPPGTGADLCPRWVPVLFGTCPCHY